MSDAISHHNVPAAVAPIVEVMSSYPGRWALCGGWAVDAWLGRISREHGDVDISVFVQDQRELAEHLRSWQLLAHDVALPSGNGSWWDGNRGLQLPAHVHGRPPERTGSIPPDGIAHEADGFMLDIQLDDRDGGDWVVSRDPLITVPIASAVTPAPWGLPAVAPHVLLYFKSRDLRRRDKADFAALLPHLTREQRAWLRDAVATMGHPWLSELSVEETSHSARP